MAKHRSRSPHQRQFSDVVARSARDVAAGRRGPLAYARTAPQPLEPDLEKTMPAELEPVRDSLAPLEFSLTPEPVAPPGAAAAPQDRAPAPAAVSPVPAGPAPAHVRPRRIEKPAAASAFSAVTRAGPITEPGSTSAGFSASKQFAIDVEEFAHDPELEEASIRFANGDDAGAEAGLMEVLAPQGARSDHDETWLTPVRPVSRHRPAGPLRNGGHRFCRALRPLGPAVVLDSRGRRPHARAGGQRAPQAGRSRRPTGHAPQYSARKRWRR